MAMVLMTVCRIHVQDIKEAEALTQRIGHELHSRTESRTENTKREEGRERKEEEKRERESLPTVEAAMAVDRISLEDLDGVVDAEG